MTQTCYWCLEFGHSYCNFFYFHLNLHHNNAKHENSHKITSFQTQKTINVHEKSEEFNVISGKTHHRQEQKQHEAPVERHGWVERIDTVEIQFVVMKTDLFKVFVTNFEQTYSRQEILTKSECPSADFRSCGTTRTRKPVFQNLAKRNKSLREAANKSNYERNKKKQVNKYCSKKGYWKVIRSQNSIRNQSLKVFYVI